jgi:flagellar biosynthesis/type III secretory pathway M-ring protein FliF/YscJ
MVEEMFKKILMRIRGFLNQPIEKQLMVLILIVFLIFLLTLTQYVSVLTESATRSLYTP